MIPLGNRPLIPLVLALGWGIVFSRLFLPQGSVWVMAGVLAFSVLCISILPVLSRWKREFTAILVFCLIGVLFGSLGYRISPLSRLAGDRAEVVLTGTLLEPVELRDQGASMNIKAEKVLFSGKSFHIKEKIRVSVYRNPPPVRPGERLKFPARLRPFKNFNNPGHYDYAGAMELRGFTCGASVSDGRYMVSMGPGDLPLQRALMERIQLPVRAFLKQELGSEDLALFRALILGERQGITRDLRETFNRTGLGHILAVSGLHVGLIACVAFFLISKTLTRSYTLALKINTQRTAALLTCIPVICYACLAGLHISTQRAMIMILAFMFSFVLGREREVWSTLALAALIILCLDPGAPFTISFQLSFAAVIGILWLSPLVFKRVPVFSESSQWEGPVRNPICKYFLGLVIVSFCAVLFLTPVTTFYFHRISLTAVPANATVLPILGFWVIPLALLSCLALFLIPPAASFFLEPAAAGLHLMMEIIRFWSGLDWASFWTLSPNIFEIFLFYALMSFLPFVNRRWWGKAGVAAVGLCMVLDAAYWTYEVKFNRDLRVTFFDTGQTNSALVEFPRGKKMLIDCGGFPGSGFDIGRMVVAPALWHSKILDLDFLVMTHPQADHMNGLPFIARVFDPEEFWYSGDRADSEKYRELMEVIDSRGIRKCLPGDLGEGRNINGVRVLLFHPLSPTNQPPLSMDSADLNNRSLVLKVSYGGKSVLFPGDIERAGEEAVVARWGRKLRSDILLSPHHGSKRSSSWPFLRKVSPRVCVISSGEGNLFGFPHPSTLRRLEHIKCKTIRTDRSGAVRCRLSPDRFEVKTFLDSAEG